MPRLLLLSLPLFLCGAPRRNCARPRDVVKPGMRCLPCAARRSARTKVKARSAARRNCGESARRRSDSTGTQVQHGSPTLLFAPAPPRGRPTKHIASSTTPTNWSYRYVRVVDTLVPLRTACPRLLARQSAHTLLGTGRAVWPLSTHRDGKRGGRAWVAVARGWQWRAGGSTWVKARGAAARARPPPRLRAYDGGGKRRTARVPWTILAASTSTRSRARR